MEQFPILKQPIQYNYDKGPNGDLPYPGVAITPTLFVWHSTDNPEATAQNHFNYWNDEERDTSSNYVLDWTDIIELITPGYKSWNCGEYGNPISIACEICETADPGKFLESMKRARFLWKTILKSYPNLQPVSHAFISTHYGGTNHMDPEPYLLTHNWTWQMFLDYINEPEGANQVVDQWKQDIMDKADQAGLLDKTLHPADEPASNWFIAAVSLRLLDKINQK